MELRDVVSDLQPVVEGIELLDPYLAPGEVARVRELSKEIRAVFDAAVERLKCGRVS